MKFIFVIQGEGRGHMTQAITMFDLLRAKGHEVTDVIIGSSDRREIPSFVRNRLRCELHTIQSPNFATDRKNKSIHPGKTLIKNIRMTRTFRHSLRYLKQLVEERQPDVLLNFYDFLAGIYHGLYRPKLRFVCIGHQYLAGSPGFIFPSGKTVAKNLFLWANTITSLGAHQRIALSFRKNNDESVGGKLLIWPPLLRKKVTEMEKREEGFFLTYIVNDGYGEEVIHWAAKNPDINIEAFWDRKNVKTSQRLLPNLTFHPIDDDNFLQKMASCRGLVSTAGFESICEALYLEKPVMVIPIKGQYEQECNALDTHAMGAGIQATHFDFLAFSKELEKTTFHTAQATFKKWYHQQDSFLEKWLQELADA